jgi:2-oxoisovalerate dehydrogenase E1 component alpha subunit
MEETMREPFNDQPIQYVGEDGNRIGRWTLDLNAPKLERMYRDMVHARMLDEKLVMLHRQGKTSFYAQCSGQEGAQIGAVHAVRPGRDWIYPYYRDLGMAVAVGQTSLELVAQAMGKAADTNKARQMPQHFGSKKLNFVSICSAIASQLPPAAGTGIAQKLNGWDEMTLVSFGEGATSEGDWHAGLNFGGVYGANIVYLCENNHYAISVDFKGQSASRNVMVKAHAYGMPGYLVDGQDVLAVHAIVQECADRARQGGGPSLIEAQTYRYGSHSSADDDSKYRPKAEVEAWKKRDPIERFRRFLEREGIWTKDLEDRIRSEITAEIDAAVTQAEASGEVTWDTMFDDVFLEMPATLRRQKAALGNELTDTGVNA